MEDKKISDEKINEEIEREKKHSDKIYGNKNDLTQYRQPDINTSRNHYSYGYESSYGPFNGYSPKIPFYRSYPQDAYEDPYYRYQVNIKNYDDYETLRMNMRLHKDAKRKPKMRVCSNCVTTTTPSWRRSTDGKKLLCNACGLYQKLHGRPRPFSTTPEGKTKALKSGFDKTKCMNCGTTDTTFWRKGINGASLCNSCGLYSRNALSNSMNDKPKDVVDDYPFNGYNGMMREKERPSEPKYSSYDESQSKGYNQTDQKVLSDSINDRIGIDNGRESMSYIPSNMYNDRKYNLSDSSKTYHPYNDDYNDQIQSSRPTHNDYNQNYYQNDQHHVSNYSDYEMRQNYLNMNYSNQMNNHYRHDKFYHDNIESQKPEMSQYSGIPEGSSDYPYKQNIDMYNKSYDNHYQYGNYKGDEQTNDQNHNYRDADYDDKNQRNTDLSIKHQYGSKDDNTD